jgi:hypothetical protein
MWRMANLFSVTDPKGRQIICTEEQWQEHVQGEHPELTDKQTFLHQSRHCL